MSRFFKLDNGYYINPEMIVSIYYNFEEEILFLSLFEDNDYSIELLDIVYDDGLKERLFILLHELFCVELVNIIQTEIKKYV